MGSEFSLKTAVVSLFVEGVLEIEGDEKGEARWTRLQIQVVMTPLHVGIGRRADM